MATSVYVLAWALQIMDPGVPLGTVSQKVLLSNSSSIPPFARRTAQYKLSRARALIQQITSGAETVTANHLFDKHVEQMTLDNTMMGGIPVLLGEVDDDSHSQNADDDERIKVYHLFSRRGDLERDYDEVRAIT